MPDNILNQEEKVNLREQIMNAPSLSRNITTEQAFNAIVWESIEATEQALFSKLSVSDEKLLEELKNIIDSYRWDIIQYKNKHGDTDPVFIGALLEEKTKSILAILTLQKQEARKEEREHAVDYLVKAGCCPLVSPSKCKKLQTTNKCYACWRQALKKDGG